MKKTVYILTGVIVFAVLALIARFIFGGPEDDWICQNNNWVKHGNPSVPVPTTPCGNQKISKITYNNATADNIIVDLPYPDAVTGKEFIVMGKARGTWFFEASFPVQVLDKDGTILFATPAQAQPNPATGETNWMTENFVPFKANIKMPDSYIGPATLVLKKDNPSDLRQYDASISFPITIEY